MGTGYVGLVTGLCLCELGHSVLCVDVMEEKVNLLNEGKCPIYEDGLETLLTKHLKEGNFRATTDPVEIKETDITFICVGTPSLSDGSYDLTQVKNAAETLGNVIADKEEFHIVAVKSTVTPATTERKIIPLLERRSGKKVAADFGVAVNPEFLREGRAVQDFLEPDRIVIGATDPKTAATMRSLYSVFTCPIVEVTPSTAEMIKLASNCFLATKISFINEIGNVCKILGIDVREVAYGMGLDHRINGRFLNAGIGFGGSCFPKDLRALVFEMKRIGLEPRILDAVIRINEHQPLRAVELLENHMDLKGRKVAVLGLAFKPYTDDIRESRAIPLVKALIEKGATVLAHDPIAAENFRKLFPDIEYYDDVRECLKESDAAVIVTEWPEYADPELYGDVLVIDGRGVVKTKNYEGICW